MMSARKTFLFLIVLLALAAGLTLSAAPEGGGELRSASEFTSIAEETERSQALFVEAGKVLQHPRCVNCHPAGDSPLQGDNGELHEPPVERGLGGIGVVGMRCTTCHMKENFDPVGVPGADHWVLAPRKMAWEGLTLGEICEQIKDPKRNGNRNLEKLHEHMAEDALVAWGWHPDAGREPVPGTQEVFAGLIQAWIDTGAVCPDASGAAAAAP